MRVAVLSDIHANIQALEAVLRDCESEKADEFWLLGDYVDYGAANIAVLQKLKALGAKHVLLGNHEGCLFSSHVRISTTAHGHASYEYTKACMQRDPQPFQWLKACPPIKLLEHENVLLVHGTPEDPYWGRFLPGDNEGFEKVLAAMATYNADILFVGHSHISFLLTHEGKQIVCPGSVGQPRNGCSSAQYVIFEHGTVTFKKVPYDIDGAAADIRAAGLPGYLWERLYCGK